ncbi:hypothetical protein H0H93_014227 [Arthromyces matolae]|nr:hypothetical protein H0H93_014227 [Arthromyces matolae]
MRAFLLQTVLLQVPHFVLSLWPIPRNLQLGAEFLRLDPIFDIQISFQDVPQDLRDAVSRTKGFLSTDRLQRLVVGRGANDTDAIHQAPSLKILTVSLLSVQPSNGRPRSITAEAQRPVGMRNEGYSLNIPSDGSPASLTSNSTLGIFRGLTTFSQLWYDLSGVGYTYQAPVKILNDIPAYSFPLDISGFPELSAKGAYSADEIYSVADVKDIVAFAGTRGIDVLLEFDTPGHTAAIANSHPEHIACSQESPWSEFANEPPAGQLRMASLATSNFTAELISSIASILPSSLFSTGGDELNTNCYAKDAQTQADLTNSGRTLEQALSLFVQATHKPLTQLGKTPVVWEEMVLDHNVTLPDDAVDCGAGEWIGHDPTGNSWCDPFKTWQKAYTFDPLANLTDSQKPLVLGGQQLLWTEQSSTENLDSILWPRAAVSAEVG